MKGFYANVAALAKFPNPASRASAVSGTHANAQHDQISGQRSTGVEAAGQRGIADQKPAMPIAKNEVDSVCGESFVLHQECQSARRAVAKI